MPITPVEAVENLSCPFGFDDVSVVLRVHLQE